MLQPYLWAMNKINVTAKSMVDVMNKPVKKHRLKNFTAMKICPHIQPIMCSATQRLIGAEVLLRFNDGSGNYFPLNSRIEELETAPLTNLFTVKLIEEIHTFFLPLRSKLPEGFFFTFNLCAKQITQPALRHAIYTFSDSFNMLLEISESSFEAMEDNTLDIIQDMMNEGIQFAIDEFGTSSSSLKYLENMEFCLLKLNRDLTLVHQGELVYKKTLDGLSGLAFMLDMQLAAEGVQSENQAQLLLERGVHMLQGRHYSPPLTMKYFMANYVS
jgi:EAL domain-containing protein (putative c-di-GMP-specific phosphodiesterase class I)